MPLTRIFIAITALLALVLDELWRTGRMREWTWEWAVVVIAFAVILIDIGKLKGKQS